MLTPFFELCIIIFNKRKAEFVVLNINVVYSVCTDVQKVSIIIMNVIQLDFFEKKSDLEVLREELRKVKESNDKVRKGMFARHGELAKMYIELHNRLEILERNICRSQHESIGLEKLQKM